MFLAVPPTTALSSLITTALGGGWILLHGTVELLTAVSRA